MSPRSREPAAPFTSLVDMLQSRASERGDDVIFTFVKDDQPESTLAFRELHARALSLAATLQRQAGPGERALLLSRAGPEFVVAFFGCLYAGLIAVPLPQPNPRKRGRDLARVKAIAADCGARVVLASAEVLAVSEDIRREAPDLAALSWVSTSDAQTHDGAAAPQLPNPNRDTIAFLQYTSGSTAAPRGVRVSHGNVLYNSAYMGHGIRHPPDSVSTTWLPPYHDMGLIEGLIQPMYHGFPCFVLSPTAWQQRPLQWLEVISRYGVTHSGAPNFAYDLCVRSSTPETRKALDLSTWAVAYIAAEPIRRETLTRFAEAFAPSGFRWEAFYPAYGLAEATLMVTGAVRGRGPVCCPVSKQALERHVVQQATSERDTVHLVGSGRPMLQTEVVIVEPESREECAPGYVGEIWVSGPTVAHGYWQRAEETQQTFGGRLRHRLDAFLRTGDYGFMQDGEVFITGRLKDLIIVAGRNHYPQDIEHTVERSHPAFRQGCGAAFAVDVEGAEQVIVAHEVERSAIASLDVQDVTLAARSAVAQQHDLALWDVLLLKPGSIPKTTSGKVRRLACRTEFLRTGEITGMIARLTRLEAHADAYAGHRRDALLALPPERGAEQLEFYIRDELSRALRLPPDSLAGDRPLVTLGLSSLMLTELQQRFHQAWGIGPVRLAELILDSAGIGDLATRLIDELASDRLLDIVTDAPGARSPADPGREVTTL